MSDKLPYKVCGSCGNHNELNAIECHGCGSSVFKSAEASLEPAETTVITESPLSTSEAPLPAKVEYGGVVAYAQEVDIEKLKAEEAHKRAKRRSAGCLAIALIIFLFVAGTVINKVRNYYETKTYTVSMTVEGFASGSEIEVLLKDSGETKVYPHESSGKNFGWPKVVPNPNEEIVDLRRFYYVDLRGPKGELHRKVLIAEFLWDSLQFNDKVSVEVNYFNEILVVIGPK